MVVDKCLKCWVFWGYLIINRVFLKIKRVFGFKGMNLDFLVIVWEKFGFTFC